MGEREDPKMTLRVVMLPDAVIKGDRGRENSISWTQSSVQWAVQAGNSVSLTLAPMCSS